jgi:hypothetical protein
VEKSRTRSRRGREWGGSWGHGCSWGHSVTDVAEVTDAAGGGMEEVGAGAAATRFQVDLHPLLFPSFLVAL